MKVLIVTQYFWPETFRINDLALGLKERGYEVEILTGKPNYGKFNFYDSYCFTGKSKELWNGITIYRVPLIPRRQARNFNLIINYLSFVFFGSIKASILRNRYDKIFVFAPSPLLSTIPAIILKWRIKAPLYLWVQDLWPESVTATTGIKNKGIIAVLNGITKWIYSNCDKILIQSIAFKSSVIQHGGDEAKIIYYPNSVEALYKVEKPTNKYLAQLPVGFTVMFAGNIGEAQDFDTLLKAAILTCNFNKSIKWVVLGNGRKKQYVEKKIIQHSLSEVFFLLGERPMEEMPHFFAASSCLLVSLKKKYIFSLTIPSKLQSYLACKKPIVGALDGEGARIIKDARAGLVSPAEDAEGLANNIKKLFMMSESERTQLGKNGRMYFECEFEREKLLDELEFILNN